MSLWKEIRQLLSRNAHPRPTLRKQLRLAARGDQTAYLHLVDHYLNFTTEYIYLNGVTPPSEVYSQSIKLFFTLWERLPFTSRLSDFERMLALSLIKEKSTLAIPKSALDGNIMKTLPLFRFLLITHEMENWQHHWIGLACRLKRKDLEDRLLSMRCEFCGINATLLEEDEKHCLEAIVRDLDSAIALKERAALCKKIKRYPKIKNFKSDWLNLRCEIVELRQEIRLSNEDRDRFLMELGNNLHSAKILQPQWVERMFNSIHFESFPDVRAG